MLQLTGEAINALHRMSGGLPAARCSSTSMEAVHQLRGCLWTRIYSAGRTHLGALACPTTCSQIKKLATKS